MSKHDERMYGMEGWEHLEGDVEGVMERLAEEACRRAGESDEEIADRIEWPVRVKEFRRMTLPRAESIAEDVLNEVLERLDEEYGDPDGDYTSPTDSMRQMAEAFARSVLCQYTPWCCEPTGNEILVTREEFLREQA